MVELPPNIDINDRGTWIEPVSSERIKEIGAYIYKAEYTIPVTPSALIMAMLQLPHYVPQGNPTFVRVMNTRANIARDGRNKGGFSVEVHWPLGDIFSGIDEELLGS